MSMFVGVVIPFLLIFAANQISAKYQRQKDQERFDAYVDKLVKAATERLSLPEHKE